MQYRIALTAIMGLVVAGVCVADDPQDSPSDAVNDTTVSNQSVSVSDAELLKVIEADWQKEEAAGSTSPELPAETADRPSMEIGKPAESAAQVNASGAALKMNEQQAKAEHSSSKSPRMVRPRQAERAESARQEMPVTPWYRSGFGALAIVLAVVFIVFWMFRRWVPSVRAAESGVLRVVARTNLTPKQAVALVQVGRRFLLIGVSPDRVDRLTEIDDGEEVAELVARTGTVDVRSTQEFEALLESEAADYTDSEAVDEPQPAAMSRATAVHRSLEGLIKRLRTLQTR